MLLYLTIALSLIQSFLSPSSLLDSGRDSAKVNFIVLKEFYSTLFWPVNKESLNDFPNNGRGDYIVLNASNLLIETNGTYSEHISSCGYDEYGVFHYKEGFLVLKPQVYSFTNESGHSVFIIDAEKQKKKTFIRNDNGGGIITYDEEVDGFFMGPFNEVFDRGEPSEYYHNRFLLTGNPRRSFKQFNVFSSLDSFYMDNHTTNEQVSNSIASTQDARPRKIGEGKPALDAFSNTLPPDIVILGEYNCNDSSYIYHNVECVYIILNSPIKDSRGINTYSKHISEYDYDEFGIWFLKNDTLAFRPVLYATSKNSVNITILEDAKEKKFWILGDCLYEVSKDEEIDDRNVEWTRKRVYKIMMNKELLMNSFRAKDYD